jgi:hypothetical protein
MTRSEQLTVINKYLANLKQQHAEQDNKIAQLKGEVKEWEKRVQRIKEL